MSWARRKKKVSALLLLQVTHTERNFVFCASAYKDFKFMVIWRILNRLSKCWPKTGLLGRKESDQCLKDTADTCTTMSPNIYWLLLSLLVTAFKFTVIDVDKKFLADFEVTAVYMYITWRTFCLEESYRASDPGKKQDIQKWDVLHTCPG